MDKILLLIAITGWSTAAGAICIAVLLYIKNNEIFELAYKYENYYFSLLRWLIERARTTGDFSQEGNVLKFRPKR